SDSQSCTWARTTHPGFASHIQLSYAERRRVVCLRDDAFRRGGWGLMPPLFERFEADHAEHLAAGLQGLGDRSRAEVRESTAQMSNTETPPLVAQEPSSF